MVHSPVKQLAPGVELRPIPGYPGWYAGSDGTIVSHMGNILRPILRANKPSVVMPDRTKKYVHHLVLLAFVGPRPDGMECLHRDDNSFNNSIENLRWGTSAENIADKKRNRGLEYYI